MHFFFLSFVPDLCEPKLVGEELPGACHWIRGLAGFCQILANLSDFVGITIDGLSESLLMAFWEKKLKASKLKEIKTLGGQLKKLKLLWSN